MNKSKNLILFSIWFILNVFIKAPLEAKDYKSWVVTVPAISVARESFLAVDINLQGNSSLEIQWGRLLDGEDLRKRELEEQPLGSLMTHGQELGFYFQRFSRGKTLSGFHWGMGAGYKILTAQWTKLQDDTILNRSFLESYSNHNVKLSGTMILGRLGYRYVAESVGFTAGLYLKLRHFQSRVEDITDNDEELLEFTSLSQHDAITLKRRMMTSLLPGFELGWAF